jgi:hypothetical protein
MIEAHHLDFPFDDFSTLVLHIHIHERVRIGPLEARDRAADGDGIRHALHGRE